VDGNGACAYADTTAELGCISDAIEKARKFPPPERVFPENSK